MLKGDIIRKLDKFDFLIYPIIDDSLVEKDRVLEVAEIFIKSKVKIFQYRAKNTPLKDVLSISSSLAKLAQSHQAKLIINDYVEVALKVGAQGVHLGQVDTALKEARRILGQDKIIGISTHTLREAKSAEAEGADYISVGPIFKTDTKKDAYVPRGVRFLKKVTSKVNLPVVAIGGINRKNIPKVLETGVKGVALISEVYKFPDLLSNLLDLMQLFRENLNHKEYKGFRENPEK